jgi:hypothetical protein
MKLPSHRRAAVCLVLFSPVACALASGAGLSSVLASARAQQPPTTALGCESAELDVTLVEHVRERHRLDAHVMAEVLLLLCPSSPRRFRWRILDALVLEELDEPMRARAALADTLESAALPERATAATLLARSYAAAGDAAAYASALDRLPPSTRMRLQAFSSREDAGQFRRAIALLADVPTRAQALDQFRPYDEASHAHRPWLAGTLSAILPGLGQVYAGSWRGAAVALVLNSLFIGATVELAWRRLYITAAAAGVAASIFYVGNVLNAVDLARRENEQGARPYADALERTLVPEAYP